MDKSNFIGIDLETLQSIIGHAVATELQTVKDLLTIEKPIREIILSRQEAADFLGISLTTLWSLDKSRKLPSRRIKTKVVYYQLDLTNFLNQAA